MAIKRGGRGKGPGTWQTSPAYQAAIAKLIAARNQAGLTQRDLAAKLKKQPSWIAKIEGKERRLDIIEFIAISRALDLNEGDLIRTIGRDLPKSVEV